MILKARVQVLRLVLIVHEQRDCPEERLAGVENVHARISVLVELQPVVALHPARNTIVVARREVNAVSCRCLRHAFSARSVPDRRVCHAGDLLPGQPWMLSLHLRDLLKLHIRRPLDAGVRLARASVKLQNTVDHAVVIDGPPRAGERLSVSEVVAPADRPTRIWRERLDHMGVLPCPVSLRVVDKVLEELALVNVPPALQPCLPELFRQLLQRLDVLRLRLHERLVVGHKRLDERVVLRLFAFLKNSVNEQPLEISVALTARIERVVGALRESVCTADRCVDGVQPLLFELRGLVDEYHVVFRALILQNVAVVRAVAELDRGAVAECQELFVLCIPRDAVQLLPELVDVVVEQLRIRPAHNEDLDPRPAERQKL